MVKQYFITGSGTDVGKTFIAAALCHQLREKNLSVIPLKPVITGWQANGGMMKDFLANDTEVLLHASGIAATQQAIEETSPRRFSAPLSPHMAAAKQMTELNPKKIIDFCHKAQQRGGDVVLIEGAGGVMVPLTPTYTTLDLMRELKMPAILVVGTYLGAISHGLTAYHALRQAGIDIPLVVVNESDGGSVDLHETARTFATLVHSMLITIPRLPSDQSWKSVTPLLSTRLLEQEFVT